MEEGEGRRGEGGEGRGEERKKTGEAGGRGKGGRCGGARIRVVRAEFLCEDRIRMKIVGRTTMMFRSVCRYAYMYI